ncbi:MAG: hypothetical protein KJO72_06525, partial [Gammaproteobacteria bacterium]|nr:hypothetical protein [Gammaproteobacteria bacterium]
MTTISGHSYIAGEWVTPGGAAFYSLDPRDEAPGQGFRSCEKMEVDRALTAAERAYTHMRTLDG